MRMLFGKENTNSAIIKGSTKKGEFNMSEEARMWEFLEDEVGVSKETLQVVTDINGYSLETLNDVLYAVTGYRTREQYEEDM